MARDDLPDDLDELLDDGRADLEARFQELERDAEIDRMRRDSGAPPRSRPSSSSSSSSSSASAAAGESAPAGDDPLSEMKDALEGDGELERYLLVLCPGCGAKNRMSLTRVRTAKPICGRCKQDLSFTRF